MLPKLQLISKFKKSTTLLLVFSLVIFSSCSSGEPQSRQGDRKIMGEGYSATPQPYMVNIRSTGELLSWEDVEIKTPIAGNVLNISFREGEYVQKGSLLVEIDSRIWQAQKKGLEAQLESASSELQRRKQLLEIEGASQEIVDQSEATVSDLRARIEELAVRIDLANIRAPFSGRLGMRNFSPGAYLMQGETITRLVQSDRLRVNFDIPSRYAPLAREGLEVRVVPSANGDTAVARIYAVEPVINAASRSLNVRAVIDNVNRNFVAGDFAQIIFEVEQDLEAILIPADAIIPELNTQVVYLAKNGIAKRQQVETGTRTRNMVHILSGVSPGDTILITGLMEVRDGAPVEITRLNQEVAQ